MPVAAATNDQHKNVRMSNFFLRKDLRKKETVTRKRQNLIGLESINCYDNGIFTL